MTKCKVIALANQKGGTAKTTTTLNLGIGLVHQGRKVLMVDADPQGDLTTALGWTDADNLPITLETQMKKILQDEPFVYNEGILHHEEGVDIIPTIFGIIKELKQCNYVKVIVIANTDEICIFRKNCASVPEERSAVPLQTEQSSAGLLVTIIYSAIPARKFKTICLGGHSA